MSKELEETKKTIKDYIHDWISNSTDEEGYTKYEIGKEEQEFFKAIETVLQALEDFKEGKIVSIKLLENFYLVNKDKEKQMTLSNKELFDNYIPKEVIENKKLWLEENILNNDYASDNDKDIAEYQVNVLQELLLKGV